VWTPRPLCNECGSARVEWTAMSGKGEVYSFAVIRQVVGRAASKAFEPDVPYVVAWVDLAEGPRMISNIIRCPIEDVQMGMQVSVVFEQQSPEIWLPKFRPAAS
ncbi:MAG: OB-fold domain-containing protein, partial [Candidatus Binatia bacterium]